MASVDELITENIDIWTSAIKRKSSAGRGGGKKIELYGVKKLRELILDLAVRGLLVPQDPNDEPASELLNKISIERNQLVKEKTIRKLKQLPDISSDEEFMNLPAGWEFARLNSLGDWGAGATPSRRSPELYGGSIPWFKSGELNSDFISLSEEYVTEAALTQSSLRYNKAGDVLVAMYGATIGKTAILSVAATTNQAVCACTPFSGFGNIFLLTLLKAIKPRLIGMGAGGAQPNISREKIISTVVALPPEPEQHRIVAKVDELMALCDLLEQQTESSLTAHKTLVQTLLGALTQAAVTPPKNDRQTTTDAPTPFTQAWNRLAEHFDTVFTTEDSIEHLKQTILQLAVMGKLVPQDPNDEPASELLKRIAIEKAELVKAKKIKKQKALPAIGEGELLFQKPQGWNSVRFYEIADEIATGPFGTMIKKDEYILGGTPLINPSHMINGSIIEDENIAVSKVKTEELSAYKIYSGDIVMARRGEMGRCAVVGPRENKWLCGTGSFVLRFHPDVSRAFIILLFKSQAVIKFLNGESVGTTMTNLNHGILNKMPINIPPTSEQHRIVTKVNDLIALCDQIKAHLADAQKTQLHLADVITDQAIT